MRYCTFCGCKFGADSPHDSATTLCGFCTNMVPAQVLKRPRPLHVNDDHWLIAARVANWIADPRSHS